MGAGIRKTAIVITESYMQLERRVRTVVIKSNDPPIIREEEPWRIAFANKCDGELIPRVRNHVGTDKEREGVSLSQASSSSVTA